MNRPTIHIDTFEDMMLITQDSPTLHSNTHDAIDKALSAGWVFDDCFVVKGVFYIILIMPYDAVNEALYAQHKNALTMEQWYHQYMDKLHFPDRKQ